MPQASPIGLFDSGVGGLSVAREIVRQLPAHPLIYLADQAHAPYGQRSLAQIQGFAEGITRFLLAEGARVIVIACNTASAAALHWLRREFPTVPFIGMEPAIKPAAERTRSGHVGVIATAATFQGELFASLLDRFANGVIVHTQVCPELVPLVEAGELDSAATTAALDSYLAPLLAVGIDQLVLGCTHYPFLRPLIELITGPAVEIIDPAAAVARQTGRVLAQRGWLATPGSKTADAAARDAGPISREQAASQSDGAARLPSLDDRSRFFTTGDPLRFQSMLRSLLGLDAPVKVAAWQELTGLRSLTAPR
ncbi:MAG: glutamate racemase [Chloroflexi bacterium]|nr:glutamate racemase [Chloroflexota bacterium]